MILLKRFLFFIIFFLDFSILFSKENSRLSSNFQRCEQSIWPFTYSKSIYPKKYFTQLSYLFMNFFEDGIEFAELVNSNSKDLKNEQKFHPGCRLTFGFSFTEIRSFLGFPPSKIDIAEKYLDITWTYIRAKRASSTGDENTIYNLFLPPNFLHSSKAFASLLINFNTLDFNVTKPYCVSRYYISQPSIGIRLALIDQKYKIAYQIANAMTTLRAINDYLALGLKIEYLANFFITSNHSFYSKTNFALLYGKIDFFQQSLGEVSALSRYVCNETSYQVRPCIEMGFGFNFERSFKTSINKLSITIGYEFLYFWNQMQLKRFMSLDPIGIKTSSRNNLQFNGLLFSISLDI